MSESVVSDRREELLGRLRCEREARARSLPSTLAQRSLVAHAALSGGDGAYHLVGLMLLKGAVDVRRVEEGVARVRARHPVLGARLVGSTEWRVPEETPPAELNVVPMDGGGGLVERALDFAGSETGSRLDPATGQNAKFSLLARDDEAALCIALHHAVADGGTFALLVREIAASLFAADEAGRGMPTPETVFSRYAHWEADGQATGAFAAGVDRLAETLEGARPALPSGLGSRTTDADSVEVVLTRDEFEGLRGLGAQQSASPFMVLLAVIDATIYARWGSDDITVGTSFANRWLDGAVDAAGLFVNPLAIRVRLAPEAPFASLVDSARAACLAAYRDARVPFPLVTRALGRPQLFDVEVIFHEHPPQRVFERPGLALAAADLPPRFATSPLVFSLWLENGGLRIRLTYDPGVLSEGEAEQWVGHARRVARGVGRAPGRSLDAIVRELRAHVVDEAQSALQRHGLASPPLGVGGSAHV